MAKSLYYVGLEKPKLSDTWTLGASLSDGSLSARPVIGLDTTDIVERTKEAREYLLKNSTNTGAYKSIEDWEFRAGLLIA